jgi:hypothetical protein
MRQLALTGPTLEPKKFALGFVLTREVIEQPDVGFTPKADIKADMGDVG